MRALQAARKVVTVLVVEDDWIIREDIVTDLRQEDGRYWRRLRASVRCKRSMKPRKSIS